MSIFNTPTSTPPKKADEQIIRVPMDQSDLGARKSHMPDNPKSPVLGIQHVPNVGSKG